MCSFITKYSATINIAFLSPFNLRLRISNFASSGFYLFSTLVNNEKELLFCHCPAPQDQSSFLQENRLQIQRRKHNTDPAQNKKNRRNLTNKNKTSVGVFGQHVILERQGSFDGGDHPCSQIAKSSRNKNQAVWTTAPLLDSSVVCRNSCGLWTGRALEGLLGWVVVECCWHVWPLLQLVILQMKFLRDADTISTRQAKPEPTTRSHKSTTRCVTLATFLQLRQSKK